MGNKQAVAAVQGKAIELDSKQQALEKSLKDLQGSIQNLQGTVDSQKQLIEQQKTAISALQKNADELAVIRVVNQLATDINGREFKAARELFEDTIDYDEYAITQEHPRSKLAADDLVENLRKSEGVYKGISWVFSSPHVTINGDEANVICQFRANHFQAHNEKGVDWLENQGTFRQTLVRTQGTWKIKLWKYTTLAYQSGNPRLHDIAAKYVAQYGQQLPSPSTRTSTSHMNIGVALMSPGKSPSDLRHTSGPEQKKEAAKVEIEKVALKKTEPVKKEEPKKVEIPKTRLASSSINKREGSASMSDSAASVLAAPPADTAAPTPVAEEPAPVAAEPTAPVEAAPVEPTPVVTEATPAPEPTPEAQPTPAPTE